MAYDTNINFSEQTLENMFNEITFQLSKAQNEIDQQTLYMRQAALRFLTIAKQNEQRMKDLEERARLLKNKRSQLKFVKGQAPNENALKEYNNFKNTIQIENLQKGQFDIFFKEAMIFNDTILSILEGKQLISLVVENAGQPVILDITLQEFFKIGGQIRADITSRGNISARLNTSIIQTRTNLETALQGDKILNNDSFSALTKTYQIAKNDYSQHSPYAFWKLNGQTHWHGIKIAGGYGDIAQAYSMFAHTYGPISTDFNSHWQDLDTFFREGVAKVDNISGLYTSDVVTQNGYSLAVKTANASLPGFKQMIDLANKIIKNKIENINQLKELAQEKKGFKDGVKKNLRYGMRNKIYEDTNLIPKQITIQYNLFSLD